MIALSLKEIAAITGGTAVGDDVTVTAPAVFDGRRSEPGGLFVAFDGERVDGHDYAGQAGEAGAVAVLGSRPTALPTVVVADAQAALQALAANVVARLRSTLIVVGVTGSQGKTSTKDLVGAVLASAAPTVTTAGSMNNELGVPVTMLRADADTRCLALEMGARRVGDIAALAALAPPDIGVVLNVGQAHLSYFGTRGAIAKAKGELVEGLTPGGTAVLNADDPAVVAMRALTDGPVLTFGRAEHADVRVLDLTLDRRSRPTFTLRTADASAELTLPFIGAHQACNAAAAAAVGLAAGIPLDASAKALAGAALSKWRMELRELPSGVVLLNDSYNANPDSARAALDALAAVEGGRRIAVLGDMAELGDASEAEHRAVGRYAAARADIVIAVGTAAQPIAEGAGARSVRLPDNGAAIDWLRARLAPGDVVLVKASREARLDEVADAIG
ncbi:UDP-N-acetylmuramoyl-tripeptide--D-alanyl-D-alanine ligase [Glycomyces algeriensis]|uniref:UDP-N-acetylmuramoyl-tripeptide--D-alanyl-D-alanine ligase n=1 Tax=Glycomyces algeriensis TaxID=256037 RepID=A0A9W6GAC7_9ACTN|nr:UDP-N-acetylmuramoyl-tripeptide--D-alanyl-D-alanine ligase [Glycomyces algeriensis]MDA1364418.1 UDP-N-acetylmuramoyl-tripeptide--D-alanyl-D-alanine ligase [Glycomyces algeriensis]MDR7350451.1 UDP-N-acetylmuramoyl-tripeptide--D-alanyl-D-alanine ligase [Glycomyces algeriensis]GLI43158.1 UDP-N-acetylmuramoyl-tripeptide--D-alanyl-D-alanine ligase [Glycomyces algeriensis]